MKRSADKAVILLAPYQLSAEDMKLIYDGIADHEFKRMWGAYRVGDGVAIADKLCEASGVYICFRHATSAKFAGPDVTAGSMVSGMAGDIRRVIENYNAKYYPPKLQNLALAQQKWTEEYVDALENEREWAIYLTESMRSLGREKRTLENAIASYKPAFERDAVFKEEALKYINGEKLNSFQDLIS